MKKNKVMKYIKKYWFLIVLIPVLNYASAFMVKLMMSNGNETIGNFKVEQGYIDFCYFVEGTCQTSS